MKKTFITIDIESYFDKDCNIKKLGSSQYVAHPDFEVLSLSYKTPKMQHPKFIGGPEAVRLFFERLKKKQDRIITCCHNSYFDMYVAYFHYGFKPAFLVDTLCMAQVLDAHVGPLDLDELSKRYDAPIPKGKMPDIKGKRWKDLTPEEREALKVYNNADVSATEHIALQQLKQFPLFELKVIDLTLKMFVDPMIEIDAEQAQAVIDEEQELKRTTLAEAVKILRKKKGVKKPVDDAAIDTMGSIVRSNDKFRGLLEACGYECPMKWSEKQKKEIPAIAKADLPFQKMMDSDDASLKALVDARLASKSSINETRAKALLQRAPYPMPIGLMYASAHTFRWGGTDKVNPQNLPRDGRLRKCLVAPDGYVFVIVDASQIEARDNATFAEQWDLMDSFRQGNDVYAEFASEMYGFEITKQTHPTERFVGKTCLGAGTKVLTKEGWKPILKIRLDDELWDGEQWVRHQGVSYMGRKKTISLSGLELTPSHEILTAPTKWEAAQNVHGNATAFQSALDLAISSLLDTKNILPEQANTGAGNPSVNAGAAGMLEDTTQETCATDGQPRVTSVQNVKPATNAIGSTSPLWRTTCTEPDCLTAYPLQYQDATILRTLLTSIMGFEVSKYVKNGAKTVRRFLDMCRRWMAGMFQNMRWIELTQTKGTNPATLGSSRDRKTCTTNEKSQTLKPVYDILNSGSKNRFTVLTDRGPIIVHNCILGLGYQMGASKFMLTLEVGMMGPPLKISPQEAQKAVNLYRTKYYKIKQHWYELQSLIPYMMENGRTEVEHRGIVIKPNGRVLMPNGLHLEYPGLTYKIHPDFGTPEFEYWPFDKKYRKPVQKKLYGGLFTENCIAEGTEVLTKRRGWVPIEQITPSDQVHDGVDWTPHGGLLSKGVQGCVTIEGVQMTPNHEVLTNEGWQAASQSPRPYRPNIRGANSDWPIPFRREETALVCAMPVWEQNCEGGCGAYESYEARRNAELRLSYEATSIATQNARYEQPPGLLGVAVNGGSLSIAYAPSLQELWRSWHNCLQTMAKVRKLLGRYGRYLRSWFDIGSYKQQQRVLKEQLSLGRLFRTGQQPTRAASFRYQKSAEANGREQNDVVLPLAQRPVYDITNAGPRQRFVVRGNGGPFIVHNCVQSRARIMTTEHMLELARFYRAVMMAHDEIVMCVPIKKADACLRDALEIMSIPPRWNEHCPLAAEGEISPFYTKP